MTLKTRVFNSQHLKLGTGQQVFLGPDRDLVWSVSIWVPEPHFRSKLLVTLLEIAVNLQAIWLLRKAKHIHYTSFSWPIQVFLLRYSFQSLFLIHVFKLCLVENISHTEPVHCVQGILTLSLQTEALGIHWICKCISLWLTQHCWYFNSWKSEFPLLKN